MGADLHQRAARPLAAALAVFVLGAQPASGQAPVRKIGEMELSLLGVSASVDPPRPVVPKNVESGVRIVVRAGGQELPLADVARFLGAGFEVAGELSGPGLRETVSLPRRAAGDPLPADPLLLPLPALAVAGEYQLTNLRLVANGRPLLDVTPSRLTVEVIDQILVTSVKTRALTLDEIREKGIVLDKDDYLGFEFTLGLKLESKPVQFSFPVVFDRQGVAVPQALSPPPEPARQAGVALPPLPTIVPVLLEGEPLTQGGPKVPLTLPNGGGEVRIPSVLVIPGNVGYLKQFFSAQLFVANGAPVGSGLVVRDVDGTIRLPAGADREPGSDDDPLALPETVRGTQPGTMRIRGLGSDGAPDTGDDTERFEAAEQGQAEFLVRGEKEGFHRLDFDIAAVLEGLPVGPVRVKGTATGGVLVRNPYFNMTFTLPSVVRRGERFKAFVTVTNIGQGPANDVSVTLDASRMSGARVVGDLSRSIDTLRPGDARVLAFEMVGERTGQVVASYLNLETGDGSTGHLKFTLGVGERGVPLSPDTLVLPAAVDALPADLVDAALRVLGQAWSVANAPSGTLPRGVARTSKAVVTKKALALAEAGLRRLLGQAEPDVVRDVLFDVYGGGALDPGFDQLLRQTEAGRDLAAVFGARLQDAAGAMGGVLPLERAAAQVALSGSDFVSFAVSQVGPAPHVVVTDGSGRVLRSGPAAASDLPGGVLVPVGGHGAYLGVITAPAASPYTLTLEGTGTGSGDIAFTVPRGDGAFVRVVATPATLAAGSRARLVVDLARPGATSLELDLDGDGAFEDRRSVFVETLASDGPRLVSANVVGPETLTGLSPAGVQGALLFDRVVDAERAADRTRYALRDNAVRGAKRQLSGRLVLLNLEQPEGPYVPATLAVTGMTDGRGVAGPAAEVALGSRLTDAGAVVTGRVLQADGSPAPGARVVYVNRVDGDCFASAPTGIAAIPVSGDGRFEFRYVRQDSCGSPFEMVTSDPVTGAQRKATAFVRAGGERLVLDIALLGRGSVAGTVRDLAGAPVAGAQVVVVSVTDPQVGAAATTDGDGRYEVRGITVGPVSVTAVKGTVQGRASGRVDRAGTTATVDVTIDGGVVRRVSGTVRKLEKGVLSAIPGVAVVYSVQVSGSGVPVAVATADAEGRYLVENVPPGNYWIDAGLNTRDRTQVSGVAAAGAEIVRDLLIEVPPEEAYATVAGHVRLPDGSPAAGAIVSIGGRGVLAGVDGAFTIPGVTVAPNVPQKVDARTRDGRRSGGTTVVVNTATLVGGVVVTLSGVGAVEFTVLDPAGRPLAGQVVALLDGCASACGCLSRTSGTDGRVRFDSLALGSVTARVVRSGSGYVDEATASASVPGDGRTGFGVLRFGGAGTVAGVVLTDGGTPAHGADVALNSRVFVNDGVGTCNLVHRTSHRARTDETGRFRFSGVNVGPVGLVATHPFFPNPVGAQGHLPTDGQQADFTLRLANTTAGELTGTVFLPDGVTPAGAGVEVTANGALPDVVVSTNAQGVYRFARILPEGSYTVTARDPVTGGLVQTWIALRRAQDARLDVRLKGRGRVLARVVDGADQPVSAAFVRLTETGFPGRTYEAAVEPANGGLATFEAVFEGPFSLEASDALARGGRAGSVVARPGQTVEVKVRLTTTGRVRGRFLMPDGTTPIPYGVIRLSVGGRGVMGQVTTQGTGDVGSFAFDSVPAGSVQVDAQDPLTGRTGVAYGELTTEGETVVIDVKAQSIGSVTGLVTGDGSPRPGASVEVTSGEFRARTYADGTGRYTIHGVPEGRVVAAASDSVLGGSASATLSGEGTTLTLDVALAPSGRIEGQVVTAGGQPAPASYVTARLPGNWTTATATGADGRFAFERIPASIPMTVAADVAGSIDRGETAVTVPPSGTANVVVTLQGVGALRGRGLDSAGQPTAGSLSVNGHRVTLGADGAFSIPEILSGPFTAVLETRVGELALYGMTSGTLAPGETKDVVVQVQPSGTVTGRVVRSDGVSAAYGSALTLWAHASGTVRLQAGLDGRFTVRGLPLGDFTFWARDAITGGLAVVRGRRLTNNGEVVDLGTIVLDDAPPTFRFLEPVPGTVRAAFGGPLTLEVADVGVGVDATTLSATCVPAGLAYAAGRAVGNLEPSCLAVGENVLVVTATDLAGNTGRAEMRLTITGGTVRGRLTRSDGTPAAGFVVHVGGVAVTADAEGVYARTGMRAGRHDVVAVDPETAIEARRALDLLDGADRVADLAFPAAGRIRGTVRRPGGAPAPGVVVSTGGRTATTDGAGAYDLGAFVLGTYAVEASTAAGDRGRVDVTLSAAGQVAAADVVMNGLGDVQVTVREASGAAVGGASVALVSSSPFAAPLTRATDASGVATFSPVLAGVVTATASLGGRAGSGSGGVLGDGGSVAFTVTLESVGRVEGTVRRADGSPAPGVVVRFTGTTVRTTTTDAGGAYAFDLVPLGAFTVRAEDAATGDRSLDAAGSVPSQGSVVTRDLALHGTGAVRVRAATVAGAAIEGARIVAESGSPFGGRYEATTDATGGVDLPHVLAGPLSITATSGSGRGTATATVAAGGAVEVSVVVHFEPVATIRGRVSSPDGSAAAGVTVQAWVRGALQRATTDAAGDYSLTALPLAAYEVDAVVDGHLRARAVVTVESDGQTVVRDLTLVGVATVRGQVRDAAGAGAPGARIDVRSQAAPYLSYFRVEADASGAYTVAGVPLGPFAITASRAADRVDATGSVARHGEDVVLDLRLLSTAVTLPLRLVDGHGFLMDVQPDGSLSNPDDFGSSARLTLRRGGVEAVFAGSGGLASTEDGGREVVTTGTPLPALRVTRKTFVPYFGYFARHLDTVTNEASEAAVVEVEQALVLRGTPAPVASGSGDATVAPGDPWVTVDDANAADVFDVPFQYVPLAVVVQGQGGAAPGSLAFDAAQRRITARWSVTIAPGASVSLLHAVSLQSNRDRAAASAARLAGLPPELLSGLTPEEAATVANFVVPGTLVSSLPALPLNDGTISGRVLAGDGATPAYGVGLRFRSASPHYGRPKDVWSSSGLYEVRPEHQPAGPLPRQAYTLEASTSVAGVSRSWTVPGSFPSTGTIDLATVPGRIVRASSFRTTGEPELAFDGNPGTHWVAAAGDAANQAREPFVEVAFPGTATVREIRVRGARPDPVVTRVRLELRDPAGAVLWTAVRDLAAPTGDVDVAVEPPVSGAGALRLVSLVDTWVSAAMGDIAVMGEGDLGPSSRSVQDVVLAGTSVLGGRVLRADGTPLGRAQVRLRLPGGAVLGLNADDAGAYRTGLLLPGAYTLTAWHPLDGFGGNEVSAAVEVPADAFVTRDLVFPAFGALRGTVRTAAGQPIGAAVTLVGPGFTRAQNANGTTGAWQFPDLPPGDYTLKVRDWRTDVEVVRTATVVAGPEGVVDVAFGAVAPVEVTATLAGSVLPSAALQIRTAASGQWAAHWDWYTRSNGRFTFAAVPAGTFEIRVELPGSRGQVHAHASGEIVAEGQTVSLVVDLPGTGTLRGVARSRDGASLAGRSVELHVGANTMPYATATADATGAFVFTGVPVGAVRLRTQEGGPFVNGVGWTASRAEVEGTVPAHGADVTLDALAARGRLAVPGTRDLWVVDATAGATVDLLLLGQTTPLPQARIVVHGPDGVLVAEGSDTTGQGSVRVSFVAAAAGTHVVTASHGGPGGAAYVLHGRSGGADLFRAYAGAAIDATVTRQADGTAVPDATVRLSTGHPSGPTADARGTTDAAGRHRFTSVPPGTATLELRDGDGVTLSRAGQGVSAPGEVHAVGLTWPTLGRVEVTAARGGVPQAAVPVTVTTDNPVAEAALRSGAAATDAGGRAVFPRLAGGTVTASVVDPESGTAYTAQGTLADGATLLLALALPAAADTTAPGAITDLRVVVLVPGGLDLAWTAPGDDGQDGRAAAYDLRYATSAITAETFAAAIPVSLAAPGTAGASETAALRALPTGTLFLALRTADAAGNWSGLSNVVGATVYDLPRTGMRLWLRADAGLTLDGAGNVSAWADQSGAGNHAQQPEATRRPRVGTGPAGLPVLTFDGTGDYVSFPRLANIRTVFWVVREDAAATPEWRFPLGDTSATDFHGDAGGSWWSGSWASGSVLGGVTRMEGVVVDGRSTRRPTRLTVVSLVTTGPVAASSFSRDRNYDRYWWGDLAELLVYDRPLTDDERLTVEVYLAQRHGAPLTLAAPVISPHGGEITAPVSVTITGGGTGVTVRYTLDGSEPTASSTEYVGPFTLAASATVKAKAFRLGVAPSPTATAGFIGPDAFAPSRVSGLRLWLRADAGVGLDASNNVTTWTGVGSARQDDPARRPKVVADGTALPRLSFDGDDTVDFAERLTGIRTVFWVVKESASAPPGWRFLLGDTVGYDFGSGDGRQIWSWQYTSPAVKDGVTRLAGVPVDGTVTARPTSLAVLSVVTTGPTSAARFSRDRGFEASWTGELGELVIYDRALTDDERVQVEAYLARRHGVPHALEPPRITPAGGDITGPTTVTVVPPTAGATVRYTTDGSEPGETSALYTAPFTVAGTTTVKARTFGAGLQPSPAATATFLADDRFHPARLSGLKLWLRADAGVATDSAGAAVTWTGTGSARQDTAARRPRLTRDGVLPRLTFDGADDTVDFAQPLTDIRSAFWVVKEAAGAEPGWRFLLGDTSTYEFASGSAKEIWSWQYTSALVLGGSTRLNGTVVDGRVVNRPTSLSLISLVTTGNTRASGFSRDRGFERSWHGELGELVIYDRPLSDIERSLVEDYLRGRFGLYAFPRAISGRVRTEGGTAAAGLTVRLRQPGQPDRTAVTDATGFYAVVLPTAGTFALDVLDTEGVLVASGGGTGAATEGTTFDLVAPARGTVTVSVRRGQTVLPGVAVTLTSSHASALPADRTRVRTTDGQGNASAVLPAGLVTARATVDGRPLEASGTLAAGGTLVLPLTVAVTLTGVVIDGGDPTPGARVVVKQGAASVAEVTADANGEFVVPGLAALPHEVWAFDPASGRPGRAPADLSNGSASVLVSLLAASGTGTVRVHAVWEQGPPAAGATVVLTAPDWPEWRATVTLDAEGRALVSGVPAGYGEATVGAPPDLGWEDFTLAAAGSADVEIRVGDRYWLPVDLTGAEGFPYLVNGSGAAFAGPDYVPFDGNYAVVDGEPFPWRADGRLGNGGREVVVGPRTMKGLALERSVYVPPSGRFVRVVDSLTNPTSTPIAVVFDLEQYASHAGRLQVAGTASGDGAVTPADDWLIVDVGDGQPVTAFVVGGPGASRPNDELSWSLYSAQGAFARSRWNDLVVPPGATVRLMQFAAQTPDAAEATARARALAALTERDALSGLTADEIRSIVNFAAVPPSGIEGVVTDGDTGQPVAGARVLAASASSGTVVGDVTADAAGRYRIVGLPAGPYQVLAKHAATGRPGRYDVAIEADRVHAVDVRLYANAELGTARIRAVRASDGQAVAGQALGYGSDTVWQIWWYGDHVRAVTDASGLVTVSGMPPGNMTVFDEGGPSAAWEHGEIRSGEVTDITLRFGTLVPFPADLTGADGLPRFVQRDAAVAASADYACRPWCGTWPHVGNEWPAWRPYALARLGGRELEYGPIRTGGGLLLTRRVYVPPSGAFVRTLEIVRNDGATPRTFPLYVDVEQGPSQPVTVVSSSGDGTFDTGDRYVVSLLAGTRTLVFAAQGPGSALPLGDAQFYSHDWTSYYYGWPEVTLAPGEAMGVLTFVADVPEGDVAAAAALGQSLVDLAHPDALTGIPDEDRARIVNFAVAPQGARAGSGSERTVLRPRRPPTREPAPRRPWEVGGRPDTARRPWSRDATAPASRVAPREPRREPQVPHPPGAVQGRAIRRERKGRAVGVGDLP